MARVYKASHVTLHVRKSNRAALGLYRDTLGFRLLDTEKAYCEWSYPINWKETYVDLWILMHVCHRILHSDADGEDAYVMRRSFNELAR